MSDIFPKWTNRLPVLILVGLGLVATATILGVTYYFTPKYTDVGYQPQQPVYFPHSVHADQLGIDCRYCHNDVDKSWYSNIPGPGVCMNCHNQVLAADNRLLPVREAVTNNTNIPWVQIHKLPDYVYFNHSVHVNRGISCVHCHGDIHKMDEVYHAKPLSMAFCLDCHRDPAPNLRPPDKVTDLAWNPHQHLPKDWGVKAKKEWKVNASQNCSACHR